ncbi:MAG: hypothetical protein ACP5GH_04185 [Nitrososphaeria archaeon]
MTPEEKGALLLECLGKLENQDLNTGRTEKHAATLLSIRMRMSVKLREDTESVVGWVNESGLEPCSLELTIRTPCTLSGLASFSVRTI